MAALSRRRFLGAAVSVVAAAGVIAVGGGAGALLGNRRDVEPDPVAPPAVPDALTAAIAREQALLNGYLAAAGSPGLAERTAAIVADHTEHLRVLALEQARITGATTLATAQPSASGPPPTSAPAPLDAAVATLAGLESAAAAEGAAACL
ncbi:MAG: hypothetical protein JWN20_991, partial [Jatrophihabitantaceae bacterium]|nr:hypothetical protein [Jatrophihabitantaceae bacterium]